MKKFAALILLLTAPLFSAEKPLLIELGDFSAGVDTQHLPDKIKLNNLADCMNLQTDKRFGLSRRPGDKRETGCGKTTTRGLWSFISTSNEEWLIRLSCRGDIVGGTSIGSGDNCFSVCLTTNLVNVTVPTDADTGLGRIWLTNRTDGLMSWDGSTYRYHRDAPKAARVAIYKNRVVLADISNAQSSIRLSGELNGDDWSNDSRFSTSPLSIPIGGVNDGTKLYDFYPGLGEGLIFKANSMWRILGNDQRDFRVEQITPQIGTIYPNTISQRGMYTLFLSNRGLDAYSPPYNFENIGNPIQNQLDALARSQSSDRSFIYTSQAQWEQGTSNPVGYISTTLNPGSIRPANQNFVDTNKSDFDAGTLTSGASTLRTDHTNGSLVFTSTAQTTNYQNRSFQTVDGTTGTANWNVHSTRGAGVNGQNIERGTSDTLSVGSLDGTAYLTGHATIINGFGSVICSTTIKISILDTASNTITSQTYNIGSGAWQRFDLVTLPYIGFPGRVSIEAKLQDCAVFGTLLQATITAATPVFLSSIVTVYARADSGPTGGNSNAQINIDLVEVGTRPAADFRANFKSRTFDTIISSPNFDKFQAGINFGTATWGVQTSSSSDDCCWEAATTASTNTAITSTSNRYIRYLSSFSVSETSTMSYTIQVNSVTLGSFVDGTFQTNVVDLGSDISQYGLFTAQHTLNDGSIGYQLQSSADGTLTDGGWVSATPDAIPSLTVRRYVAARITFDTSFSTQVPLVESITLNWVAGSAQPRPVGTTYRDNYHLFYSSFISGTNQGNDRVAIFNRVNVFDQSNGSTIAAAAIYNNTLIWGDGAETGDVYSMDNSTDGTDNNRNVESYFQVKRLTGDEPDAEKIFEKAYITISRDDTSTSQLFKVEYALDGSTTMYRADNVEISTGSSYVTAKSLFSQDLPVQGKSIDLRISELTQRSMPYHISRMRLYGRILEVE